MVISQRSKIWIACTVLFSLTRPTDIDDFLLRLTSNWLKWLERYIDWAVICFSCNKSPENVPSFEMLFGTKTLFQFVIKWKKGEMSLTVSNKSFFFIVWNLQVLLECAWQVILSIFNFWFINISMVCYPFPYLYPYQLLCISHKPNTPVLFYVAAIYDFWNMKLKNILFCVLWAA